jgi:hypothetical protein
VSNVYDVSRSTLTPYASADTGYGGIAETASDLDLANVISSTHVALANVTSQTVDWIDTTYGAAIAAQTPAITGFRTAARHGTGSIAATQTSHFWLVGRDSTTSTTARIVRCEQCSSIMVGGCGSTALTCSYATSVASSTFVAVQPYTSGGLTTTYGGAVAAINFSSGAVRKRLLEDGTGKDLVPSTAEADDSDGAWNGLLRLSGTGQVLAYGSGTNNLRVCSDPSNTGDTTCATVTGLPNQSVRAYHRAAISGSAVAMLATASSSNYLVLLPTGLSPSTGSNWREVTLANSGSTVASAVAVGPSSFMVLGKSGTAPYVWYWGPP